MINVVCMVDDFYLKNKMKPWMEYAQKNINIDTTNVYIVGMDTLPEESYLDLYPKIRWRHLKKEDCSALSANNCGQHGEFLRCFPEARYSDTFILIDGDALIQRDFTSQELNTYSNYPDFSVGMNWNAGFSDTLADEAMRLAPLKSLKEIKAYWKIEGMVCCNVGVMIANFKTWNILYNQYLKYYKEVENYFWHVARQQWLLSWIAQRPPLTIDLIPLTIHNHTHYGFFPGVTTDNENNLYYKEELSWVRHKWGWFP